MEAYIASPPISRNQGTCPQIWTIPIGTTAVASFAFNSSKSCPPTPRLALDFLQILDWLNQYPFSGHAPLESQCSSNTREQQTPVDLDLESHPSIVSLPHLSLICKQTPVMQVSEWPARPTLVRVESHVCPNFWSTTCDMISPLGRLLTCLFHKLFPLCLLGFGLQSQSPL